MYVGNDINDLKAMMLCGYTVCPRDSHKKIKEVSSYHLKSLGGNGVVREIVEELLEIDMCKVFKLITISLMFESFHLSFLKSGSFIFKLFSTNKWSTIS